MYAVGRLGSYISRGVYTVSAPFHPFGGAVDIIVVEQPDGSFKSSPWYVRFGKFQGVLKSKEKLVRIRVNDVDVNFHMYLDNNGEAHFLREVDGGDAASVLSPCSSGDETDEQLNSEKRPLKSKSCDYDGGSQVNSDDQVGVVSNGDVVTRTNSRRGRIFGFVFGRRSMKEGSAKEGPVSPSVVRSSSLECAEIAADLLEVNWSTDTPTSMSEKDKASKVLENDDGVDRQIRGEEVMSETSALDILDNRVDHPVLPEHAVEEDSVQFSCATSMEDVGPSSSGGSFMVEKISYENANGVIMEVKEDNNQQIHYLEACPEKQFGKEKVDGERGVCGIDIHVETMLTTTGHLSEDIVVKQAEEMELDVEETSKIPESSSQTVSVGYMLGSVNKVVSPRVFSRSDSESQIQDEKSIENGFHPSLNSVCDSVIIKSFPPSDSSEEEQFLFSDLDNFKLKEQVCANKDHQTSISTENKQVNGLLDLNNQSHSFDPEDALIKSGIPSDPISIQRSHSGEKDGLQHSSLPNMWPSDEESCMHDAYLRRHSLDSNSEHLRRASPREKDSSCIKPYAAEELQSVEDKSNIGSESTFQPEGVILVEKSSEGDQSKTINSSSGRWKIWPFSFKGSKRSEPIVQEDAKVVADNGAVEGSVGSQEGQEDDQVKPLAKDGAKDLATENADDDMKINETNKEKRWVKATTPTSEQVASLNLKDGKNDVTFTFSTEMLGEQQVDARIFLWKWNTRIVISDVDGTITKSDVLGQFMPMVGMDWSHTGVTHLFSAIKENGYELLFLSARSISQAYITRQFLVNLKQDGKALPDGPVVISPDGLFPSLFREVIRRAPHEFKIACLEVIRDLFPSDSNPFPFYAGFGNRHTDEFSYLKVGIPKGKIFIINPKGEVAVHRRVDTGSYTSLHDLVHGIFPLRPSSEQEDYNSWNYWKLPPPEIK